MARQEKAPTELAVRALNFLATDLDRLIHSKRRTVRAGLHRVPMVKTAEARSEIHVQPTRDTMDRGLTALQLRVIVEKEVSCTGEVQADTRAQQGRS